MSGEEIDIGQVKLMVDRFMEEGFTYFDTAWVYNGSEDAIRQALVERYPRESFQFATKNAAWVGCKTKEEAQKQFEESLRKTGAGMTPTKRAWSWANIIVRSQSAAAAGLSTAVSWILRSIR